MRPTASPEEDIHGPIVMSLGPQPMKSNQKSSPWKRGVKKGQGARCLNRDQCQDGTGTARDDVAITIPCDPSHKNDFHSAYKTPETHYATSTQPSHVSPCWDPTPVPSYQTTARMGERGDGSRDISSTCDSGTVTVYNHSDAQIPGPFFGCARARVCVCVSIDFKLTLYIPPTWEL